MKSQVVSAVRFPTRQHGISFDSGSSATKVYWIAHEAAVVVGAYVALLLGDVGPNLVHLDALAG